MTWLTGRPLFSPFDAFSECDGGGAEESLDDGGSQESVEVSMRVSIDIGHRQTTSRDDVDHVDPEVVLPVEEPKHDITVQQPV